MSTKFRIPITSITVFGTSSLLVITVGIVLFLGFGQAAHTTRQLWADRSHTLINSMEQSLESHLRPIREQALWISKNINDLSNPAALDDYIFGSLAAAPMVVGVAIVTPDGKSRRWHRDKYEVIEEDWSKKIWMSEYLQLVRESIGPVWRDPIFTSTVETTTLLHDTPLRDANGKFIGIFAQIIPISEVSAFLVKIYADTGVTPFVLYNRDFVLAHPAIVVGDERQPLTRLEDFDDLVLQRIWSPDETDPFIATELINTTASGIFWGDIYYLYLYRKLDRFGPAPWTIGAYLNTSLLNDDQTERLVKALLAGLVVLVLAVIAAIFVGRKVSAPIKSIVDAASTVEVGELDRIDALHGSHIRELDDASNAFNHMVKGLRERKLIRDTLGRFVPERVANSLLEGGGAIPVQQTEATILFCDIESFTQLTEALGPVKIVDVLNAYFSHMVDILENHGGVVTQFQGDAILATFNVPIANREHARNAILAAVEMLQAVGEQRYAGEQLNIRIGINTGSVVAGAIGARGRLNYTVHGDAVNLAARLENLNKQYQSRLMIAETSASLVSDMPFTSLGETTVRGQSRSIKLYTLKPANKPDHTDPLAAG